MGKVIWTVICVFGGFIIVMLQIPAEEARSNLSTWLKQFGFSPDWAQFKIADRIGMVLASIMFTVPIIFFIISIVRKKSRVERKSYEGIEPLRSSAKPSPLKIEDQEAIETLIKQQEQLKLAKKEIDFKIILTDSKAITAIENVDGKRFLSNPTLEMSVTFLPNQSMQFAELYLRIEKEEIRPSLFDLNLPYIIKDGETHKVMFQIPFKFADKKSRKVSIVALVAGREWKSKKFDVKFG